MAPVRVESNKNCMLKEKWITEAVVVAFIPVAASIVAFAYELGSARFYGIATYLIKLSWTSIALAIVALVGIYQMIRYSRFPTHFND